LAARTQSSAAFRSAFPSAARAVNSIAAADMVVAFRSVLVAAAALMAGATLLMVAMEERALAGPATVPVEMAE
jgi:hypothetical protein